MDVFCSFGCYICVLANSLASRVHYTLASHFIEFAIKMRGQVYPCRNHILLILHACCSMKKDLLYIVTYYFAYTVQFIDNVKVYRYHRRRRNSFLWGLNLTIFTNQLSQSVDVICLISKPIAFA